MKHAILLVTIAASAALVPHGDVSGDMAWSGGNTNWASENWEDADGNPVAGWPGDATHVGERANLKKAGTLYVNDGDFLNPGLIYCYVDGPAVVQNGGTNFLSGTLIQFTPWTLNGGLLGGTGSMRIYDNGIFTVTGGKLGNRDENSSYNFGIAFYNKKATLDIQGGMLRPHNISMNQGATQALIRIHGATADITTVVGCALSAKNAGSTATLELIFSEDGISTWSTQGGSTPHLSLGTGETACRLKADVSAYRSDGVIPVTLFNYAAGKLAGTFYSITITDANRGTLVPGTIGNLALGEYAIDYAGGDGSDIVLYFNNKPPEGTVLSIR